ncbi:MAG: response regulator transcription factor, partial [Anaerovorax sp.]
LILLDINLPDISGVDLCLELRRKTQCHILFLSCKSEEIDKIIAFSAGGDDYITKPFQSGELIARVKAHLRRNKIMQPQLTKEKAETKYIYEGLLVDTEVYKVYLDGQEISLTPKEFQILLLLIAQPKRVFSMDQIFELVWKTDSLKGDSRTVMVYISNLRKKIEPEERGTHYIVNIRGVGYKFNSTLMKTPVCE